MTGLIILLAGTGVGVVAGLFGVGGSFLLVPLLGLTTPIPADILVGSCACQVLGPATTATLSYRIRLKEMHLPLILLGGIVSGTLLGARVLARVAESHSAEELSYTVQLCYLGLMWSLGIFGLWEWRQHHRGRAIPIGWLTAPWLKPTCEVFGRQRRQAISVISLSLYGVCVGLFSGFLGVSGGVLLVPGLHYLYGIPTKRSARLSMILVGLIAVQATCIHAIYRRIDLPIVALLLFGGTVGAQVGVRISERMSGGGLRRQFAWLLLVFATLLTFTWLMQTWFIE
ncbi:MAG: sulfite exporter TauE/SafE family protein [Planctomycetaceae bacterium]|nr:sulfite exporter TauE/SafE family protein [Planctomycetaceae bacterium]